MLRMFDASANDVAAGSIAANGLAEPSPSPLPSLSPSSRVMHSCYTGTLSKAMDMIKTYHENTVLLELRDKLANLR